MCEYPKPTVRVDKTLPDECIVKRQQARIEELEAQLLRANGNLSQMHLEARAISTPSVISPLPLGHGTKRSFDGAIRSDAAMFPCAKTGLVKLDKQSTYIEAYAFPCKVISRFANVRA